MLVVVAGEGLMAAQKAVVRNSQDPACCVLLHIVEIVELVVVELVVVPPLGRWPAWRGKR